MMFTLKDSSPGEPLLLHEEPIYFEDKIIGRTTSGNYSFCYDKNLSFGYVDSENSFETLKDKKIFIEVEKKKYLVKILEKPLNQNNYRTSQKMNLKYYIKFIKDISKLGFSTKGNDKFGNIILKK